MEAELLRHYLAELARLGVAEPPSFDEAKRYMAIFLTYGLIVFIINETTYQTESFNTLQLHALQLGDDRLRLRRRHCRCPEVRPLPEQGLIGRPERKAGQPGGSSTSTRPLASRTSSWLRMVTTTFVRCMPRSGSQRVSSTTPLSKARSPSKVGER